MRFRIQEVFITQNPLELQNSPQFFLDIWLIKKSDLIEKLGIK